MLERDDAIVVKFDAAGSRRQAPSSDGPTILGEFLFGQKKQCSPPQQPATEDPRRSDQAGGVRVQISSTSPDEMR